MSVCSFLVDLFEASVRTNWTLFFPLVKIKLTKLQVSQRSRCSAGHQINIFLIKMCSWFENENNQKLAVSALDVHQTADFDLI